ncbi:MAG: methyl-accepting chemotaxis protein [Burkholderiales bacterium]
MEFFRKSIGARLLLLLTFQIVLFVTVGLYGLATTASLKGDIAVLAQRSDNMHLFGKIRLLMHENREQLLLALQHSPDNPARSLHDHPISVHLDKIAQDMNNIRELWGRYKQEALPDKERRLADNFEAARERYMKEGVASARDALLADDFAGADKIILTRANPLFEEASTAATELERLYARDAAREVARTEKAFSQERMFTLALLVLGTLLAAVAGLWLTRGIVRPLSTVMASARHAVNNNDFTAAVPVHGSDETARTAEAFNALIGKLRDILSEARTSSARIAAASHSVAQSAQQIDAGSQNQSEATSSVAAALEEISVALSETSNHAKESEELVQRSRAESDHALSVTRETMTDMGRIADVIKANSESVLRLSESSEQISGIVGAIKEIADQTNLLALNAAIEAARAGEQGRGFAVVADEVRKLAERTANSTQEISGLIATISQQVDSTVTAMQVANSQAAHSVERAHQAEEALRKIADEGREIGQRVKDISNSVREQDVAVRDIAVNVEKIAQMTEENSATAQSNGHLAGDMSQLADTLQASISRYKL